MKFEEMEMGYNESLGNSSRVRVPSPVEETPTMVVRNNNNTMNDNNINIFKECLKNHAVSHGGHTLDGCCEFLPAGPEGSLDAFKCAVYTCHRNFHRKEAPLPPNVVAVAAPITTTVIPAEDAYPHYNNHSLQAAPPPEYMVHRTLSEYLQVTRPPRGGGCTSAFALISPPGGRGGETDHDDAMDIDTGGIGSSSNSKKRFRTKFTAEQKEKMKAFAERMDWRMPKQDDNVVQEFCNENGVNRRVLKVWIHNNKHTLGKKP